MFWYDADRGMEIFWLLSVAAGLLTVVYTGGIIYSMHYPQRRTVAYALANKIPIDPGQIGLDFEEQTFTFGDGTATSGWVIRGNSPDGPVVVVTHGWSSSRYGSLARVPAVLELASSVVVYDMRGHGESTAKRCRLGASESHELLEIVRQVDPSCDQVVLWGVSMGAGISIVAAAIGAEQDDGETGRRIVGVIAEGPYRLPMEPVVGHLRQRKWPVQPFVWLVDRHYRFWIKGYEGFDRSLHAAKLGCPLLVLHGSDDLTCPFESAEHITESAPSGRMIVFDAAGHSDLYQSDSELYCRSIAEFVASVQRPTSVEIHTRSPWPRPIVCYDPWG